MKTKYSARLISLSGFLLGVALVFISFTKDRIQEFNEHKDKTEVQSEARVVTGKDRLQVNTFLGP